MRTNSEEANKSVTSWREEMNKQRIEYRGYVIKLNERHGEWDANVFMIVEHSMWYKVGYQNRNDAYMGAVNIVDQRHRIVQAAYVVKDELV